MSKEIQVEIKESLHEGYIHATVEVPNTVSVSITMSCQVVAMPSGKLFISCVGEEKEVYEFIENL